MLPDRVGECDSLLQKGLGRLRCYARIEMNTRIHAAAALLALGTVQLHAQESRIVAVSSRVSDGYSRVRLVDGSYQPETYTFGEGGQLPGQAPDESIDKLTIMDIAKVIAPTLKKANFVPVEDRNPEKTKLLIMVYWGTTPVNSEGGPGSNAYWNLQRGQAAKAPPPPPPPNGSSAGAASPGAMQAARQSAAIQSARESSEDSAMAAVLAENWQRDQEDMRNALLLGYDTALNEISDVGSTPMTHYRDDLVAEVEQSRYFVVLMAYDYQALWTHRKHRLLWVTRFSVRAGGTNFTKVFPSMVSYASKYFGVDSHGLIRRDLPDGQVDIGDVKSLGSVP